MRAAGVIALALAPLIAACPPGPPADTPPDAFTLPDAMLCLPTGDVDLDGLSDVLEGCADQRDTDGDGIPDMRDQDSDGDGLLDGQEDLDGDGQLDLGETDPRLFDTDGDDFDDAYETGLSGTDPTDPASVPGPHVVLPFGATDTTEMTFLTDEAAGPVDVYVRARKDVWNFVRSFDPATQSVSTPGTPVVFTVTASNDTFAPTGGRNYFTVDIWLTAVGGVDLDIEPLWVVIPAP